MRNLQTQEVNRIRKNKKVLNDINYDQKRQFLHSQENEVLLMMNDSNSIFPRQSLIPDLQQVIKEKSIHQQKSREASASKGRDTGSKGNQSPSKNTSYVTSSQKNRALDEFHYFQRQTTSRQQQENIKKMKKINSRNKGQLKTLTGRAPESAFTGEPSPNQVFRNSIQQSNGIQKPMSCDRETRDRSQKREKILMSKQHQSKVTPSESITVGNLSPVGGLLQTHKSIPIDSDHNRIMTDKSRELLAASPRSKPTGTPFSGP